jgi:hypothetical protein
MTILTDTGFPPTFLNRYILSELAFYGLVAESDLLSPGVNPMVPAQIPTNIEDLYNDSIQIRQTESPVLIVYDRLMRFRPTPFYAHKREQLIYFIYSTDVGKLIDSVRVISNALDREDASAQDVNSYSLSNPILNSSGQVSIPYNIYFHNTRVYQADESRDVAELASARTLFVNKLIVEYDYHIKDSVNINGVEVETRYK